MNQQATQGSNGLPGKYDLKQKHNSQVEIISHSQMYRMHRKRFNTFSTHSIADEDNNDFQL